MMPDEEPPVYAIRLLRRAAADIDAARNYVADTAGERIAQSWRDGLNEALRKLSRFPQVYPIAEPENALIARQRTAQGRAARIVRVLPYRRPGTGRRSPAWRVLFTVREATESDVARVVVLHVRHAARMPLTAEEAASLADDLTDSEA